MGAYFLSNSLRSTDRKYLDPHTFFFDVKKAYDMVWRMACGTKCRKWMLTLRYRKWLGLYMLIMGAVFLKGKSYPVKLIRGGAQGCNLLHTLFLIYINGFLCEIENCPELGVKFLEIK